MSSPGATPALPRRALLGGALVVMVALAFTTSTILARLAYQAGSDAVTVLALRYTVVALLLYFYFRLRGQAAWLPRPLGRRAIGVGLLVATYAFGYLGAVQYIPVSLAVLIFYTYPLLTGIGARLFEREALSPGKLVALALGLLGVALAVEVSLTGLDWRGLGLAVLGAVGIAASIIASQRAMRSTGSLGVTFYVNLVAASVYLAVGLLRGGFALPVTEAGWHALVAMPLFFLVGIIGFFAAVSLIGGVKTATVMNVEPVFTVLAAVLVLGEHLAPLQLLGAALVVLAIFLVHRPATRS